ncbi:MAG: SGNH/GDSL hydrolase family protein [Planctomycetes bacterium]|nr:SGNH/GDSL hydrolase family protein [Planctomycetota bacterium]
MIASAAEAPGRDGEAAMAANIHLRGGLLNSRIQFERHKTGHVVFLGGSITEMAGYRPRVCGFLRRRFPETKFTFTNAGIASTGSTTGAFRLRRDVLDKGAVDLLLVEFAVNDDQDGNYVRRDCIRGMEGIIRHTLAYNPCADIVVTYFVNPNMLEEIRRGRRPVSIAAHETVAEYYGVSSVDLAAEVARRIEAGTLTWKRYGGTHPHAAGNDLAAGMVRRLLESAWGEKPLPPGARKRPHPLPRRPIDEHSYYRGRFIDPDRARADASWTLGKVNWKKLPGMCRSRFVNATFLSADKVGAELKLAFEGPAIGAYLLAGPDAGTVEARVANQPPVVVDLYHRFSSRLHYPRTVMFYADLPAGKHELTLRILPARNRASRGHAVRILYFTAN